MAQGVWEFAKYNLNIRYHKDKDVIIFETQSKQFDIIDIEPANKVEKLWLSFQKIDKNIWYNTTVAYLKDDTILDNRKISKLV